MGVCYQNDVLYEILTVEEHLKFIMDIKEKNEQKKQDYIEYIIEKVIINLSDALYYIS